MPGAGAMRTRNGPATATSSWSVGPLPSSALPNVSGIRERHGPVEQLHAHGAVADAQPVAPLDPAVDRAGQRRARRSPRRLDLHQRQPEPVAREQCGIGRVRGRGDTTGRHARSQPADRDQRRDERVGLQIGGRTARERKPSDREQRGTRLLRDLCLAPAEVRRVDDVAGHPHEQHDDRDDTDRPPPTEQPIHRNRDRGCQQHDRDVLVARLRIADELHRGGTAHTGDDEEHNGAGQERERRREPGPARFRVGRTPSEHQTDHERDGDQGADARDVSQ